MMLRKYDVPFAPAVSARTINVMQSLRCRASIVPHSNQHLDNRTDKASDNPANNDVQPMLVCEGHWTSIKPALGQRLGCCCGESASDVLAWRISDKTRPVKIQICVNCALDC